MGIYVRYPIAKPSKLKVQRSRHHHLRGISLKIKASESHYAIHLKKVEASEGQDENLMLSDIL